MRAGELLGARVRAADGRSLGVVQDIRLGRRADEGIVIEGVLVGRGTVAARLGYAYGDVAGPWLLATILRRRRRRPLIVPWERLEREADGSFCVLGGAGDPEDPSPAGSST